VIFDEQIIQKLVVEADRNSLEVAVLRRMLISIFIFYIVDYTVYKLNFIRYCL
jgi:hypothetical protein